VLFFKRNGTVLKFILPLGVAECGYSCYRFSLWECSSPQLGKAYWDVRLDGVLMSHPVTLNLLFIQAINEAKNGSIVIGDPRVSEELATLRYEEMNHPAQVSQSLL
jgi:hypothetical protein